MAQGVETGQFEIFDASSYKVGIVCAQFNTDIMDHLLKSALGMCAKYSIPKENITTKRALANIRLKSNNVITITLN